MKTIKQILLTIAVLLSSLTAKTYGFEVDGIYYGITNSTKKTVGVTYNSSYRKYSGDIVIPDTVVYNGKTYSVIEIYYQAFRDCYGITNITIPNSVTSIGEYAFYGCTGLVDITIPNSVTSIGNSTFYGCTGLVSVIIPNSVTSIGEYAFKDCHSLASIAIPNSVTSIGEFAFENCHRFTSITIPNSVTHIYGGAFDGCNSLKELYIEDCEKSLRLDYYEINNNGHVDTYGLFIQCPLENLYCGRNLNYKRKDSGSQLSEMSPFNNVHELKSVTIGGHMTSIDSHAFYGCMGLVDITIHNSVTSIGYSAFYGCTGLVDITIPNSVTSIGYSAFYGCTGLVSVIIPNSVTSIGEYAFKDCHSLASIAIPNSVTSIGECAFKDCHSLASIAIPNSVTSIGSFAFQGCTSLERIYMLSRIANVYNENIFSTTTYNNATLYVPEGREFAYSKTVPWSNFYIKELKNSYNVTYKIDGEIYATYSVECFSEIPMPDTPTKEGYSFSGWSEAPETMPAHDVEITGSFSVNTYTITYIVDGEVYATDELTYGSEIVLIDEPTKEGNTFSGWSEAPETMPAYDVEITGSFSVNTYAVTYIVNGEIYATDSLTYGSEIVLIDEPTKEGYTFSGWSEAPETMPAHDVEITGLFSVNTYTITYIVDGEVYATDELTYGSEIILRDEPTKEGYSFSGWSEAPETMPAEDIEIIGSFSVNTYAVTYMVDGEVYATDSLEYSSEIVLIDEPTKEGHTFSGWSEIPETMPAYDVEITGSFSVNTYAITYMVDGEVYATDSLAYGSEIVLIDEPTKEGYTFSGWSEAPETMPANDIEITGSFSVNTYAVTYIVDGAVYATDSLAYRSEIVLIDEPTKEGYTFSGWSEVPETMPAEDIEITGSFIPTENVSEVEFDANIQTTNNGIILLNANNNWVRVYTINGILVKKIDNYTGEEITLNKGVYIVSVGNKAIKIML